MRRDEYPTFVEWYCNNVSEYNALRAAIEGDSEPLASFLEKYGYLATREAREYIASRLRGEPRQRGNKRTIRQMGREFHIYMMIRKRQIETGCSEYAAVNWYLSENCEPSVPLETLKTQVRNGKKLYEEMLKNK